MLKRIFIIAILLFAVFVSLVVVCFYLSEPIPSDKIPSKLAAVQIGRPLLKEHFPNTDWDKEKIVAEEKDGVWRVHNYVDINKKRGQDWYVLGGEVGIELDRKTGQFIREYVDD